MIRTILVSAVATTAFASAAIAAEVAAPKNFTQEQAAQHLVRLGYTGVSELEKDNNGRWVGYAFNKDGNKVPVAIDAPRPAAQ